jgi:hypothetical protein
MDNYTLTKIISGVFRLQCDRSEGPTTVEEVLVFVRDAMKTAQSEHTSSKQTYFPVSHQHEYKHGGGLRITLGSLGTESLYAVPQKTLKCVSSVEILYLYLVR